MIKMIQVTKFEASDGTLHDTKVGAEGHEAWVEEQNREQWVRDLLGFDFTEPLSQLKDGWRHIDDWQQEDTIKQLVQAVIRRFSGISEILGPAALENRQKALLLYRETLKNLCVAEGIGDQGEIHRFTEGLALLEKEILS